MDLLLEPVVVAALIGGGFTWLQSRRLGELRKVLQSLLDRLDR
jgi:hypothetical protein